MIAVVGGHEMIRTTYAAAASCLIAVSICHVDTARAQTTSVDWSGLYGGGFGEYGTGHSSQHDDGIPAPVVVVPPPAGGGAPPAGGAAPVAADGRYGLSGGMGGGFAGFNYQANQFVLGVEGDIGAGSISGSSAACGTTPHLCGTRISALADIRGRLGYAIGSFLPYVAGGAAFANLHASDSFFGTSGGAWRTGYTIGAGIEYKFSPRVSVRVEYLHAQFDPRALFNIVPGVPERVGATTEIVRAGIAYYFTPPPAAVVAKY